LNWRDAISLKLAKRHLTESFLLKEKKRKSRDVENGADGYYNTDNFAKSSE
jgi:hypothetical protein